MITPDLVSYIENQLKKGKKKEDIISRLVYVGWYREDIDEGFSRVVYSAKPFGETLEKIELVKKIEEPTEEFIPNLMLKDPVPNYDNSINKTLENKKEEYINVEPIKEEVKETFDQDIDTNNPIIDFELLSKFESSIKEKEEDDLKKINTNVPSHKNAIISSFLKDSVRKNSLKTSDKEKKHISPFTKWMIIFLVFISIIFGFYIAISKDYIKIPEINFRNIPILGGDLNKILISRIEKIENSQFYKIESDVLIKSSGNLKMDFISGNVSLYNFPEEVRWHTLGIYENLSPSLISFDSLSTILSDSWLNKVVVNLKHNGSTLYIPIESLSMLVEMINPSSEFVAIEDDKINEFINTITNNNFGDSIGAENILVNGVSDFLYQNIKQIYSSTEFNILEKDGDIIKDKKVRYFEVVPTDPSLGGILNTVIKGSKVNSFEFWTDEDEEIFKYRISLSVPASYISKSSSEFLKVEISSTFYDINGTSIVNPPENFIKMDDILININDIKNRDAISSFKNLADEFYNISSSYGKKPNNTGSCSSPLDGSLFSSLGHGEDLQIVVGDIKNKINELNISLGENIFCYSTAGAWAISVPLETDSSLYWCTDNTGETIKTTNKLSSAFCQ
ncbi:TPA: hypothetical protein DIC38_00320 [Candidatus Nomurabacteria bacterium]|nr:MAG: hypothetical protein O210_OD1C00001G0664 [Parcubacteria bacterium RAAC4_OD1_1]HCY26120.1 hypothetical protein [Candidatus Nomurabacteria bacterium]